MHRVIRNLKSDLYAYICFLFNSDTGKLKQAFLKFQGSHQDERDTAKLNRTSICD